MYVSTYGYEIADQGDLAKGSTGWMSQQTYNWLRHDAHNHDGVNSPLIRYYGPFFNVQTYGATGDGTTDDTIAIQACINAASNFVGATVFFPGIRNQYKITNSLTVNGNTSVKIIGEGPGASQLRFRGTNAVPMFILSSGNTDGVEISNLSLNNSGSATMAIQVNCTKAFLHNLFSFSPVKFSTAVISDYQASSYSYYVVIKDCYFSASGVGQETPIGIRLCGGHTKIVESTMLTGFLTGINLEPQGDGGHLLGASITNSHIESFDGSAGPGSTTAVGVAVNKVFSLNLTGTNFQMNGSGSTIGGPARDVVFTDVGGANLHGNLFFRQGEASSAAISIATANIKGLKIAGNKFYDMLVGVEVLNQQAEYEIGLNAWESVTTRWNDTFTPTFTGLTVVAGGGSVAYSGRISRHGNMAFFVVYITPAGGATTASTVGTTYFTLPTQFTPVNQGACIVADDNQGNLGIAEINTNARVYMPDWTASVHKIIISGNCLIS